MLPARWATFLATGLVARKLCENPEYRLLKLMTGAVRWCITECFWPARTKKKEIYTYSRSPVHFKVDFKQPFY